MLFLPNDGVDVEYVLLCPESSLCLGSGRCKDSKIISIIEVQTTKKLNTLCTATRPSINMQDLWKKFLWVIEVAGLGICQCCEYTAHREGLIATYWTGTAIFAVAILTDGIVHGSFGWIHRLLFNRHVWIEFASSR